MEIDELNEIFTLAFKVLTTAVLYEWYNSAMTWLAWLSL